MLVDRVHCLLRLGGGTRIVWKSIDHAIRAQRVLHGEALPEKLRIPHQQRSGRLDRLGQTGGGADGHRVLAHDHLRAAGAVPQMGEHGGDRCIDVGHIRRPGLRLRGAYTDEMDLSAFYGGEVLSEGQASGFYVASQQVL